MPADDVIVDTQTEVFIRRAVTLDVFGAPEQETRALALRQPGSDDQLLRVGVAQCDAVLGETAHNTRRAREMLQTSVDHGARLTVFPQAVIGGYNAASAQDARQNAIDPAGAELADIASACARLRAYAVVGAFTLADGILRDSAFLISPEGILAQYHRAHTARHGVDAHIQRGQAGATLVQTPIGNIGMLIGRDLYYPRAAQLLAAVEAEIIAAPCAWTAEDWAAPEFVARARAHESSAFVLAANRVGEERSARYIGRSCIVAPNGISLANAYPDEEHVIIADINLREAREKAFAE